MGEGLGRRRESLARGRDDGIGDRGGEERRVALRFPGVVEVRLGLGPGGDEETTSIRDVTRQGRRNGSGEARHIGEDDGIVGREIRDHAEIGEIDDLRFDEESDRIESGIVVRIEVISGNVAFSRNVRFERGIEGQGGGREGHGGEGGGTIEGAGGGASLDDEHLQLVRDIQRRPSRVVARDVILDFEGEGKRVGSRLAELVGEGDDLLLAGTELSERGIAVVATVVDFQDEGGRRDRLVARVRDRRGDGDVTIDADDLAGKAHLGDREIPHEVGHRHLADHDLRFARQVLEGIAQEIPTAALPDLPADVLFVGQDHDLLRGIVAAGEAEGGEGEGLVGRHGPVERGQFVQCGVEGGPVGRGIEDESRGRRAADDEAEGVSARGAFDEGAGLLDGALEIRRAIGGDAHRGGGVDDEGDVLPRAGREAREVEILLEENQGDAEKEDQGRSDRDAATPDLFIVQDHRDPESDDSEEQQGEDEQPGNRRSRRDEGPREGEGEEPDEETARRHEECLLELDAAVADGEGFEEEIHRPPIDDAAGPAVQQMDDDRDRDPEGAEEEDGI